MPKLNLTSVGSTAKAVPLLFLHGFLGSASDWQAEMLAISPVPSLAVDLPGHGKSLDWQRSDISFALVIQVLHSELQTREINQIDLVGYSLGGRVGLALAEQFPGFVRNILLIGAHPGLETSAQLEARRESDQRLAQQLRSQDLTEFLKSWYAQDIFAALSNKPEVLAQLLDRRSKNDRKALADALEGLSLSQQTSSWKFLRDFPGKIWYLYGEQDQKYCELAGVISARAPKVITKMVRGAGHAVPWEAPKEFAEIMHQTILAED